MMKRTKTFCSVGLLLTVFFFVVSESGANVLDFNGAGDNNIVGSYIGGDSRDLSTGGFGTVIDSVDDFNPTGAVTHNYPPPVATVATPWPSPMINGYADSANLAMGTAAYTQRDDSKGAITTEIGNRITIGAGSSGLADGAATQLTFQFRMDGATKVYTDRNRVGSEAIATTGAVFQIWDPSQGDIDFRPYLFNFSANIWNQEQTLADGSRQHDYYWNWMAVDDQGHNWRDPLGAGQYNPGSSIIGYNDTASCLPTPANPSCNSIFDTAPWTFTIDTYVGAELSLWGWMQSISEVTGSGYAYNNFLNTMGGSLSAVTEGVELTFSLLPPADNSSAPVPEPATMLLFGTGLAGLAGFRSRKKA